MKTGIQIVECVPNFSEGRDMNIIRQITDEIEKYKGVKLLNVDPGEATNRTVVTFVGTPQEIVDAAFDAVNVQENSSTCANIMVLTLESVQPMCYP